LTMAASCKRQYLYPELRRHVVPAHPAKRDGKYLALMNVPSRGAL
jgi:hypothetical protein